MLYYDKCLEIFNESDMAYFYKGRLLYKMGKE